MAEEKQDNILRRQLDNVQFRLIDEEARMVEFVASTNSVDTYGTVIPVDKWDLSRFRKNGVIGYQHDIYYSSDPDNVIGRGEAFVEGEALVVRIYFEPAELNKRADKIFRKIQFGSINGVSVGFIPTASGHWGRKDDGEDPEIYYYNGQQLMEVSVVNIPSNPDATKRSIEQERATFEPKPEPEIEEIRSEEVVEEAAPEDTTNIRLTIARAKRQLAN